MILIRIILLSAVAKYILLVTILTMLTALVGAGGNDKSLLGEC